MNRLNNFNRLFIVFCALLICFIVWKVPHEKEFKSSKKQNSEKAEKSNQDRNE